MSENNKDKIILHLCASQYGSDTRDYRAAGYDVRLITKEIGVENVGIGRKYPLPENVYGIFANPPCTMFSIARTVAKTPRDFDEGLRLVKECLRIIWEVQVRDWQHPGFTPPLKFWAIENPYTGMLKEFLGKPAFVYSPNEFGDTFTKRTALWGRFNEPVRPIFGTQLRKGQSVKDKFTPMTHKRDFEKITDDRSIASPYFTKAFYEANQ